MVSNMTSNDGALVKQLQSRATRGRVSAENDKNRTNLGSLGKREMSDGTFGGAMNRAAFFRPARKRARELFSGGAECEFLCNGAKHPVVDLSARGFLFASATGQQWDPGAEIEGQLLLHGESFLESTFRVARVETFPTGSRVGVDAQQTIDLPDMLELDAERTFRRALRHGPNSSVEMLPDDYVRAVSAITDFLLFFRPLLDREERRLKAKADGAQLVRSLVEDCFETLNGRWRQLVVDASRAGWKLRDDPKTHYAAKQFTQATVTPLLLGCPLINRTWNKPLGYAGDYHVMEYYYQDEFEGDTVFDQLMHKLFVQNPMAQGVVSRARFMVDLLDSEHERIAENGSRRFAVANLGCGPGREVEMWAETKAHRGPVNWTLIDQEEEALALAHQIGHEAVREAGRPAELKLLHLSFSKLLRHPEAFDFCPQNLIFSSGLFDYLRADRAELIVKALYDRLVPGGLLAIGNAIGPNTNLWPPEFVADWPILYRSRNDMEGMAALLPNTAGVEVVVDPGEAYYFLLVRKG
jgi:extracellular factor (EF) 3-hydroxypalmitic acid methyl ester biosynthesis protein